MANVNFKESAKLIVEYVGGKENVAGLTHCITRLRFTLKDESKANTEKINEIPGVMKVIQAGGQYQVVIGPAVEKMYDEVVPLVGSEALNTNQEQKSKKITDKIMKLISGIMMPVMPGLIGCGLVLCLYNVLSLFGVVNNTEGFGFILYAMGQAALYFFPIIVGGSAAKYFGISPYLGNAIGAGMIYPTLTTAAAAGESITLFGVLPYAFKDYTSTVFPVIVAVWFASILYKFFKKIIPDMFQFTLVPMLTLLITVPVSLVVIGPVVNWVSMILSSGVLYVYNLSPVICGAILGATWLLFIVPLGLHWGFIAIFMNNFFTLGYEPIMGLLCGICTISGTLFAYGLKSKDPETRSLAFSTGITNIFGISEPGLYGIILQHKFTIITSMIGGTISGIIPAICKTAVYSFGGASGIFGLPMYVDPSGASSSFMGAVLANVVGFAVCFALTFFWKFDTDK
ncbi:MAG: PTS transporter subunit EIIC [Holdemanella sp.]|nr:PTS transporter subunit EIIC [Holdemanella sp.]